MALGFTVLLAQDAKLQFEVDSVRASSPAPPGTPGAATRLEQGRARAIRNALRTNARCRNFSWTLMASSATKSRGRIGRRTDAVEGGALFDISAKVPPGATNEQVAIMLQNLLKERFKLSLHHEKGSLPAWRC